MARVAQARGRFGAMKQDPHVDHFIPWSRYPRDLAQNFVLAHGACNLDKGDMLSAPAQLWVSLKYTVRWNALAR